MTTKALESVKLQTVIVNKVRANKKKTGMPIATFIEQSIEEKLKAQSKPISK